ncbi:hypothetical protein [Aliiroseovarius sp. YM-037]|uniref:hypothetical protein n=1 Tax=Aliiroseovarius sp. YM-037 TaxID=3341728 RepID=UPI003A7F8578
MKRIMLTSALVLGVAAPAFSGTAASEFALRHFAADNLGNEARVFLDSDNAPNARAVAIHTALAAETDTGVESNINLSTDAASVSTRGAVNDRAQAIFDALLEAEDAADK